MVLDPRCLSPRAARLLACAALAAGLLACSPEIQPVAAVASSPQPAPAAPPLTPPVYWVEGARVAARDELEAARDHAASLLPCPREQLAVRAVFLGTRGRAVRTYFVDGCTQRLVYSHTAWPAAEDDGTTEKLVLVSRFTLGPTPR